MYDSATSGRPGVLFSVLLLSAMTACQPAPDSGERLAGKRAAYDSQLTGRQVEDSQVLATVNGVPVYREDIQAYMDAGLQATTKDEALAEVVRTLLLADEARRRGYAGDGQVVSAFKKALALEILVQKGHGFTEKNIDEATLRAAYEQQKTARFVHGKRRTVVHALVRPPKGKGISEEERKVAAQIQRKVRGGQSADAFTEAVKELKKSLSTARIVVEKLPPFDAESTAFVAPFVKGAFEVAYPGEHISEPVETRYGIHIIFVEAEGDAANVSFEEARDILAGELVEEERRKHVAAFIEGVEEKADVFLYDKVLQESVVGELSDDGQ